jgi:hypothetical protein
MNLYEAVSVRACTQLRIVRAVFIATHRDAEVSGIEVSQ